MSTHQRWSADQRLAALAAYREFGLNEAERRTGVPRGSIRRWVGEAQASGDMERTAPDQSVQTKRRAAEAAILTREERVVRLAARLLEEAEAEIECLRELREAQPAKGRQGIAITAAILIEKSQLLAGGATQRGETVADAQARRTALLEQARQQFRVVPDVAA